MPACTCTRAQRAPYDSAAAAGVQPRPAHPTFAECGAGHVLQARQAASACEAASTPCVSHYMECAGGSPSLCTGRSVCVYVSYFGTSSGVVDRLISTSPAARRRCVQLTITLPRSLPALMRLRLAVHPGGWMRHGHDRLAPLQGCGRREGIWNCLPSRKAGSVPGVHTRLSMPLSGP